MTGYLYYVTVPLVTKEPLVGNQARTLAREATNTVVSVVLDDDIEVSKEDQAELSIPEVHYHFSNMDTGDPCAYCMRQLANDGQYVVIEE